MPAHRQSALPHLAAHVSCRGQSEPGLVFQSLCSANPSLVIVDGDGQDYAGDAAKAITPAPPTLLVTLSQPEGAGQVIDRCDSMLLMPFAPNLLSSRVGRLLRLYQRSRELRDGSARIVDRVHRHQAKANHLKERTAGGTLFQ